MGKHTLAIAQPHGCTDAKRYWYLIRVKDLGGQLVIYLFPYVLATWVAANTLLIAKGAMQYNLFVFYRQPCFHPPSSY